MFSINVFFLFFKLKFRIVQQNKNVLIKKFKFKINVFKDVFMTLSLKEVLIAAILHGILFTTW